MAEKLRFFDSEVHAVQFLHNRGLRSPSYIKERPRTPSYLTSATSLIPAPSIPSGSSHNGSLELEHCGAHNGDMRLANDGAADFTLLQLLAGDEAVAIDLAGMLTEHLLGIDTGDGHPEPQRCSPAGV